MPSVPSRSRNRKPAKSKAPTEGGAAGEPNVKYEFRLTSKGSITSAQIAKVATATIAALTALGWALLK